MRFSGSTLIMIDWAAVREIPLMFRDWFRNAPTVRRLARPTSFARLPFRYAATETFAAVVRLADLEVRLGQDIHGERGLVVPEEVVLVPDVRTGRGRDHEGQDVAAEGHRVPPHRDA